MISKLHIKNNITCANKMILSDVGQHFTDLVPLGIPLNFNKKVVKQCLWVKPGLHNKIIALLTSQIRLAFFHLIVEQA